MITDQASLLVVDDNEDIRDMISRRIRRHGYEVNAAESGHEALEMLRRRDYDLIVLDVMMPGLSGFEVLKQIRQTYSMADLPIIMATARDQSADIVTAFELGANDYVTKPLDFQVVLARIQIHLSLKRLAEARDQFVRIASHDLKNPLSVILASAKILENDAAIASSLNSQGHQLIEMILRNAARMQEFIEDFLDFQAVKDGQLKLELGATDVNMVAEEAVRNNLEYARRKGIEFVVDLSPEVPLINADRARLAQVAHNLVSNAVKFCPEGASAVVRTRVSGDGVAFEISDSGPGLTDEDMKQVFRMYARLSNKPTGGETSSGLGLAISKYMIDLHGGEIGAANNPAGGATFWFRVPLSREMAMEDPPAPNNVPPGGTE